MGFVEGRNVAIEYRWAESRYDRLPALAADLVRRRVAVIVAPRPPSAPRGQGGDHDHSDRVRTAADPVQLGLVASLNRPGGNVTGVTTWAWSSAPKRLELLHELCPERHRGCASRQPDQSDAEAMTRELQAAARSLRTAPPCPARHQRRDIDAAFASLAQLRVGGLVIGADRFFIGRSEQLAALTARHAVPAIFQYRAFAAAGGLMSYGGSIDGFVPSGWRLCWPDSQGRKAGRPAGPCRRPRSSC